MPSCVMRFCTNYTKKTSKIHGITYHSFPSNEQRRSRWVDIVRKQRKEEGWKPKGLSKICSVHFKDEDKYKSGKGLILLKKSALPELPCSSRSTPTSPNSLGKELESDVESVLYTPRKAALKKCVRKSRVQKKKLIKKNENSNNQNKKLQKKVASMIVILKHLKQNQLISDELFTELNLKKETMILFNIILCKNQKKKSYPPIFRKFALTLNFYSPSVYKYVRQVFHTALPHPRILGKWYENSSVSPGFTEQAFNMLKKKNEVSGTRIVCALVADEIALRHQSKWTGKPEGVVDFGGITNSEVIATAAYVFFLVSLNENWKLPVGYFFVKSIGGETRAHLINSCLSKSFNSGVDVVAVVFDDCPPNLSAASILGCDLKDPNNLKTTFKHPDCGKDVALLFDPCHMMKLVRNTFESKRIIFNEFEKEIKWHLLENLIQLQKNQGLNFANNLSERYLNFRNAIIKARLTTQLLSKSVASALELCNQLLVSSKFKETAATVEFIKMFNDLFDIFNSRPVGKFGFKTICPQNATKIINFLNKAKLYILSLKINSKIKMVIKRRIMLKVSKKRLVDCKSQSGFLGFLVCIESLKHLYSSLVVNQSVLKYISTYRLSLDHIEILFGTIRKNGSYKNPNVNRFKEIYKKILSHLELRSGFSGDCAPLESVPILNCSSAVSSINWSCGKRASIENEEFDYLKEPEIASEITSTRNNLSQENVDIFAQMLNNESSVGQSKQIVGYIAGWLARKLIEVLKCEECINSLLTSKKLWFHKLIYIKDMGGLCYSTESMFIVCLKSENILKAYNKENELYLSRNEMDTVKNHILKSFIGSNIFSELNNHSMTQPPTFNHRMLLIKAIIEQYVNIRVHNKLENNPTLNEKSKRQKRKKLILFEGTI